MAITPYSGTVPNRLSAGDNEAYATDVYNWLFYLDGTWVSTVNSTEVNINAKEASAVAAADTATTAASTATTKAAEALASANIAAQSAIEAEAAVASLPDGTLNDAITTTVNAWSASKIDTTKADKATTLSGYGITDALPLTGGTMTGAITSLREVAVAMGASDIDLATGNSFTKTITTITTLTFSNIPASGQLIVWKLSLTNAGAFAVTFPTINWVLPDGTYSTSIATYLAANAPRTALKTSGVDTFIFYTENGGTTVYGKLF